MKKKIISIIFSLILVFVFSFQSFAVLYTPEDPDAEVIYMISLDNDAVICDINSDMRVSPASITKVVTAILTIENCTNYEQIVTAPAYAIRLLDGTNSSNAGILPGEELSVRNLLYCLLVKSANEAANILADFIGDGDIAAFVEMMNEFVRKLGCENTHFSNAHGLDDPDHYTTARDLVKIYSYCLRNSLFTEIAGTFTYEVPATNKRKAFTIQNTNSLMNPGIKDYYCEYVKNGKTGTTDDAGRCVISSASKDGYNYLLVVMRAEFYDFDNDKVKENMAFVESRKIYEWAFKNLRIREVTNPSVFVASVSVRLAKVRDYVSLVPETTVTALVPAGVSAENVLIEPYADLTQTEVDAPVKAGDVLGRAAIKYAGETIAEVDLIAQYDVQRSSVKYAGDLLLKLVRSRTFKLCALVILALGLLLAVIILGTAPARRRNKKKKASKAELKTIRGRKVKEETDE